MTEPGYPPRRPDRHGRPGSGQDSRSPAADGWGMPVDAEFDERDLPSWADPAAMGRSDAGRRPARARRSATAASGRYGGGRGLEGRTGYGGEQGYADRPGYEGRPDYEGRSDYGDRSDYEGRRPDYEGRSDYGEPTDYEDRADYSDPADYDERADSARRPEYAGRPEHQDPGSDPGQDPADRGSETSAPAGPVRRTGRSRASKTRRRRLKRRLLVWGSVVVAAVVVAGVVLIVNRKAPARSAYVTTFQKGEFRTVPNACHVVGATALQAYLSGRRTSVIQPIRSAAQSQCTYQRDAKPTFRVLNLAVQAYQPYLDAPGNGSATSYARYSFAQQRTQLAHPAKHAPEPPARIAAVHGLGDAAFTAVQVTTGRYASNRVTVVVRYRNVVLTVYLQAMVAKGFGPAPVGQLTVAARAAAQDLLTAVKARPRVGG